MSAFAQSFRTAFELIVHADPVLLRTVALSLSVSGTACLFASGFGLALGAWLAVARFPGHRLVLLALNTLLALPSVVVGLVVYLLLSRSGPLGSWGILFTPTAMVIAQTILVLPVVAALTRQLVGDALRDGGDQLRSMGAAPLTCALLMLVHDRWAVLTVLIAAFGRAIAEVGAVMIVGGNIDGFTRVMTTTIALETSKGDLPLALALGLVLLGVVAVLNALLGLAAGRSASWRSCAGAPAVPMRAPWLRAGSTCRCASATCWRCAASRCASSAANSSPWSAPTARARPRCCAPCTACCGHRGRRDVDADAPARRRWCSSARSCCACRCSTTCAWRCGWPACRGASARSASPTALQRVGLQGLAQRPARALSGGQQQRLALARAWAVQPQLLFLDEPTASLDPTAKREVEALLAGFAADGMTLVMSTHNLGQAKRLATRVVYLEGGVVHADLPTERFFNGPLEGPAQHFLKGELA